MNKDKLNSKKIHTFKHFFQDGQIGKLTIDLTGDFPKFSGDKLEVNDSIFDEYTIWSFYIAQTLIEIYPKWLDQSKLNPENFIN